MKRLDDGDGAHSHRLAGGGAAGIRLAIGAPLALVLLTACGTTLFSSDFDQTAPGSPPAVTQRVGTASVEGPPGSVTVVASPAPPSGRWVRIERTAGPHVPGLQCRLSATRGEGEYTLTTTLFIPSGAEVVTVQAETAVPDAPAFFHVDFLEDGRVRLDDDPSTVFGTFPHDAPFILQVTFDIEAASSTARVVLSGAGASGARDHPIRPALQSFARQFGAVQLLIGFPHVGRFEATNIVVKYEQ